MISYIQNRESIPNEAVGRLLELVRDILDELAISGENPQLMARRLTKCIFAKDEGQPGLLASLTQLVNYHYYGIADCLRQICPGLTEEEIRLCCFICMGLPNHSLQYLFGFTNSASLYNLRSKIRRKLGVADCEGTLDLYLEALVADLRRKEENRESFSFEKEK